MSVVEESGLYKVIDGIKFGVFSPNDVRKLSVVEVQTADTYDEDGAPITSGLMDGRLGTLEPRQRCKTCGNTAARCPGHFGHIELAAPVVHVSFTKIVHRLLQTTCRDCGRIRLTSDKINFFRERLVNVQNQLRAVPDEIYDSIVKEAKRDDDCPHCGAKQFPIEFSKPTTFQETPEGGPRRLTPSIIRERLERITDDDLRLLGLDPSVARPEWIVLQVMPVPPVSVRPSITLESGIRSEDDLTHKLVDIIRINQRLKENIDAGAPTLIVQDLAELLQYHVTTFFDNEASGIPPARHRSGRALKTLSQRLKGKEGRFRSNLSGKRVDFSARTVISPDPNLDINEVGVPIDVAMRLTVPEKVTTWNLDEMKTLIANGPEKYPGALYVVMPDARRIRIEFADREKVSEALSPGFIVERHLRDSDIAIFNRQPSLHRMSIMAHKVKVLPYKTFRLHLCVCPPYNADFDGDEMNLHVPQSEEAQTEARLLMRVQDQMLSPRYGGPIIGAIRDFITGSYLLTRKSTAFNRKEAMKLLSAAGFTGDLPPPEIQMPNTMWSGKQVFSLFLPKGFNYVQKASFCQQCENCLNEACPHDAYVVIRNGVLEKGVVDKNSIGAEKSESVLHRIVKDYGTDTARRFLDAICKLVTAFVTMRGFTFAADELDLSRRATDKINAVIEETDAKVHELIGQFRSDRLARLPGRTLEESLEIYIMNELAHARDVAGDTADEDFGIDNQGIIMTRTGARGSNLNIGQMTACVGQQSVRGMRILRGYRDRALSHFLQGDPSPEARGFVRSSYRDGLDPIEFFFHAMGGREGLVDTAVRTQQSGYMQRRLINALEYLSVEYDGTVRDSKGDIIQFRYGEDGVDPAKSDHGKAVNIQRLVDRVKIATERGRAASEKQIKETVESCREDLPRGAVEELKSLILQASLTKQAAEKVVSMAVENSRMAQVEPGEAVGIVGAQSIGEPGTQMTLRTFHYAGVKERNVTLGLPRLIEIVDARRTPSTPVMTIRLDEEHKGDEEKAKQVARHIVYTTVEDIAREILIDAKKGAVVVRIQPEMMKDRGITEKDLEAAIKIPNFAPRVDKESIVVVPPEGEDLAKLQDKISNMYVKGVPSIRRVLVTYEEGEWVIHTDGSNLSKVTKVPGVDPARTVTNNIHEIADVLGIEAARNAIINEARSVLEEQGLDVDIRHVTLVADVMTATAEVRQIGRHGVSGEKASVLARAAFEITVPSLVEAAAKGKTDELKGVTENVIVGQSIPIGTGLIDLYMSSPPTHENVETEEPEQ